MMPHSFRNTGTVITALLFVWSSHVPGADTDWPAYGHDARRSQVTRMTLDVPLVPVWQHRPAQHPRPAWPGPAKNDYWHHKYNLRPRVTYDRAFHVAVAGNDVLFGSSADDRVVCLDAETGTVRWSCDTEGPVRLAPTVVDRRVYFGSDDGWICCVASEDGEVRWQYRVGPDDRRCIGNGRMISRWPVRSGVVVRDGVAYAAAGLFPTSEGAYLCALDARTGKELFRRRIEQPCQGYLLASSEQLLVPSGRAAPGLYARQDGRHLGTVGSPGGSYAVLVDDVIVTGAGDGAGELALSESSSRDGLFTFQGRHLIAHEDRFFVHSQGQLAALDRHRFLPLARRRAGLQKKLEALKKNKADPRHATVQRELAEVTRQMKDCWLWREPCQEPHALILVGDLLFAGGDDQVAAYRAGDGQHVWSGDVEGRAYGLAAARGSLFVSTDNGQITCFRAANRPTQATVRRVEAKTPGSADALDQQDTGCEQTAKQLLKLSGADKGFCLLVGAGDGRLAYQLARQSHLHVIGVASSTDQAALARQYLRRQGVYGDRVVIHQLSKGPLPYPDYFANLIVVPEVLMGDGWPETGELDRVLRPAGGMLCLPQSSRDPSSSLDSRVAAQPGPEANIERVDDDTWVLLRRGPLPGGGEWTHGLADPGNTACTLDQHVNGDLQIQWFGGPGPRSMTDRHHRNVAPLAKDGRLFIPGDDQLIAVDAYNGTELWRRAFPRSRRLGAFLDCSNMVVDEKSLYFVTGEHCHELDPGTGATRRSLRVPQTESEPLRHWGYLARAESLLIGTASQPQAAYYEQSRDADLALWYDNMALVTGDNLFALDAASGKLRWSYGSGRIVHTTLTIGGGRVYFIESHSPKVVQNATGRVPIADFLDGPNFVVALDLETGETVWKHALDLANCRHIMYLNYAQEKLLLSGNRYVDGSLWYFFSARDASSGESVWNQSHDAGFRPGGDHGEQNRHPTIVNDIVYTFPLAYQLHTGEPVAGWRFDRRGHGCGNIAASAHGIFWRGGNPWRMDLAPGSKPQRINSVTRLGCWINAIPAGGLLLIPEASSGCTCAYPLQTSLAYAPASD